MARSWQPIDINGAGPSRHLATDRLIQSQDKRVNLPTCFFVRIEQQVIISFDICNCSLCRIYICSRIDAVLNFRKTHGLYEFTVGDSGHCQAFGVSIGVNDLTEQVPVRDRAEFRDQPIEYWERIFQKRKTRSDRLPSSFSRQSRGNLRVKISERRLQLRQQTSKCSHYIGSSVLFVPRALLPSLVSAYPNRYENCRDRADCLSPGRPVERFSRWGQIKVGESKGQSIRNPERVKLPEPSDVGLKFFHRKILA